MVGDGGVIALYVLPITTVREDIIHKPKVLSIFQPKLTSRQATPCFAATRPRPCLLILQKLDGKFAKINAHLVITRKYP